MRIISQNLSTNTKYNCNFIINYEVQNTNTKYNCNFIINSEVQNTNTKCGPPDAVKAPPVEKCILVLSTPKLQRKEWSLKYKWMDCCLKYFLLFSPPSNASNICFPFCLVANVNVLTVTSHILFFSKCVKYARENGLQNKKATVPNALKSFLFQLRYFLSSRH